MRVRPIRLPVAGEHLLAVQPELSMIAAGHWRRRLNLFTGRSLTQGALEAEQNYRAGLLALRGLSVSPGVVSGLELDIEITREVVFGGTRPPGSQPGTGERPTDLLPTLPAPTGLRPGGALGTTVSGLSGLIDLAPGRPPLPDATPLRIVERFYLNIASGYGIGASGEDVILPSPLRIPLEGLTPCGTQNQLRTTTGGSTTPQLGTALAPRVFGKELGALLEFARAETRAGRTPLLPRAGVVVLQPVRVGTVGEFDPEDQCEIDPDAFPFEDQQIIDACRVVLYLWPEEWPLPVLDNRWRNRLAFEIFERERLVSSEAAMPWDDVGVPIALIGFDENWRASFADRAAVARAGGKPRRRSEWILGGRNRFLGQARMEQLAEQLAEADARGVPAATLAQRFRYLPPAGLLPRDALDLATESNAFFPSNYSVSAVPVPLEQLDVALEGAAMLDRYDLEADDEVEILVPVPQVWFEPRLLVSEVIDDEFNETIKRFVGARDEWLYRRQNVREKSAALVEAITGNRPVVPPLAEDPEALEPEPGAPQTPPAFQAAHLSAVRPGMHQHFFDGASATLTVQAGESLFAYVYVDRETPPTQIMLQWNDGTWNHRAYWGESRIEWGDEGTVSRFKIEDEIPEAGRWLRLEVAATEVGLEGRTLNGMAFTLFDGRVAWGPAGKLTGTGSAAVETVWFDSEPPIGAAQKEAGGDSWEWVRLGDLLTPFEPSFDTDLIPETTRVHRSLPRQGAHQHLFEGATQRLAVQAGDRLYAWVLLDPQSPPSEVMLQWRVGASWEHRAYWGKNLIAWGTNNTAGRRAAGRLPQAGRWTRLEISAEAVGLADQQLDGIAFVLHDGGAVWGPTGRIARGSAIEAPYYQNDQLPTGATQNAVAGINEAWRWEDAPAIRAARVAAPLLNVWYDATLAPLSGEERDKLLELGLERFIPYLEQRADKADDTINLGFARLNVNTFRLRQVTLGSTAASRLSVSPVFAQIARSETAVAASEQVAELVKAVKGTALKDLTERDLARPAAKVPGGGRFDGGAGGVPPAAVPEIPGGVRGPDIFSGPGSAVAPPAGEVSGGFGLDEMRTQPGAGELPGTKPGAATTPGTTTTTPGLTFGAEETKFGNIQLGTLEVAGSQLSGNKLTFLGGSTFGPSLSGAGFGARAGSFGMALHERGLRAAAAGAYAGGKGATYYAGGTASEKQATSEQTAARYVLPVSADRKAQEMIEAQAPLPGSVAIRSTTIAERMTAPAASEARDYALAARYELASAVSKLDISLDGIELTGISTAAATQENGGQPPRAGKIALSVLRGSADELTKLRTDHPPLQQDEPNFFVAGIDLADHSINLLRQVEGRVRQYRLAIDACRRALGQVKLDVGAADRRLQVIATELAEARHDVAVARALKAEEQARLDAINARRAQIREQHVAFLAYRRPRWAGTLAATPARAIDPALVEAPVPACLAQDHEPPQELRALIDLAREAPARWFVDVRPLLDRIDRVEHMIATFESAQLRARSKTFLLPDSGPTRLGQALTGVLTAQHQLLGQRKQMLMQVNTSQLASLNWKAARDTADETVSLADLMEGAHRRSDVARSAAAEIENISRIAACLHAEFAAVLPSIRLDWAERVSQFDAAVSLRNLAGLARWNEIGYIDRRQMQAYVDWLFGRVDMRLPEAAGLMNDLVRVCLLLASHAPVGQIIAGRVSKPQQATPGGRITLRPFDASKVRVGMQALMYSGTQVVARALVDDLGATEVSAQVLHVEQGMTHLAESMTVHFAEPAALGKSLPQPKLLLGRK